MNRWARWVVGMWCLAVATALAANSPEAPPSAPEPVAASASNAETAPSPEPSPTTPAEAVPPLTLKECYYMALARSETLQIQDEAIAQTKAKYQQALSGILPRLSFKATEFRQDASGSETFTLKSRPSKYFTLSQPLFRGFKEFSAMAAMRAEEIQRKLERQRAEETLYLEVAEAFFAVQQHEEEQAILQESEDLARERLEELREREALGKSRSSETASASAYLKSVQADRAAAEGRLEAARQMLGFLIGRSDGWRVVAADAATAASELKPLEAYLSRVAARADVRAAEEAARVGEQEVRVAGADRWPSVTADANYYTQREGFYEPIDWDVTLTMSVPIFQGGQAAGAVREARSLARQASLLSAQTRRDAERDVRTAYAEAAAGRASWTAFEEAATAAAEDSRLQKEDYRLGLVNNLDLLASLDRLQQARLSLAQARANALTQEARLAAGVGEVP